MVKRKNLRPHAVKLAALMLQLIPCAFAAAYFCIDHRLWFVILICLLWVPVALGSVLYCAVEKYEDYAIHLTGFDLRLLKTVEELGDCSAYGLSILKGLEDANGENYSLGRIYTSIETLERDGYITTYQGDPTPERGNRPKRFVRLTAKGRKMLEVLIA